MGYNRFVAGRGPHTDTFISLTDHDTVAVSVRPATIYRHALREAGGGGDRGGGRQGGEGGPRGCITTPYLSHPRIIITPWQQYWLCINEIEHGGWTVMEMGSDCDTRILTHTHTHPYSYTVHIHIQLCIVMRSICFPPISLNTTRCCHYFYLPTTANIYLNLLYGTFAICRMNSVLNYVCFASVCECGERAWLAQCGPGAFLHFH